MKRLGKQVFSWISEHPHGLVMGALGFLSGVLFKFPTGWSLSDANAALVGAFVGAAAAVGGALWAANAKQLNEDRKSDRSQRHVAAMIAAAIIPEIASARRNMPLIADQIAQGVREADGGSFHQLRAALSVSKLHSDMCEKFISRFDAFGQDASAIVEAVGAILDVGATNASLIDSLIHAGWSSESRAVIRIQENKARHYGDLLAGVVITLSKYHPRPDEVVRLAAWPT